MIRNWIKKIVREVLDEESIHASRLDVRVHQLTEEAIRDVSKEEPKWNVIPMNVGAIILLSKKCGWQHWQWHAREQYIRIYDDSKVAFIDVWYTKMTVGTNVNHPKQGWNRMYRKHVSMEELEKIFRNPREHTGKGYRTK